LWRAAAGQFGCPSLYGNHPPQSSGNDAPSRSVSVEWKIAGSTDAGCRRM
jgi:hypothetical protein